MLCYVILCHVMSCHVMSCHVMSFHGILCHVTVRFVMVCIMCSSLCVLKYIWAETSNTVVCANNKRSDQPAHMCSLIRAFASRLNIL